jgi:DNA-binding NarL/FixJ family response regulator
MPVGLMGTVQRIQLLVAGPRLPETRDLHKLLTQQQAIVVVGETLEISRVPELARLRRPDVVLLHARGSEFALEAIRVILAQVPGAKLLVVANSFSLDEAALVLEHGARGVLAIGDSYDQGMRAIHAVHAGEIWGSRALLSRIVQTTIKHMIQVHSLSKSSLNLTERENEIVKLLRSGSSNKEIASDLGISDKTVKTHLHNIFGKLQIHRRQRILPALLS